MTLLTIAPGGGSTGTDEHDRPTGDGRTPQPPADARVRLATELDRMSRPQPFFMVPTAALVR